LLSAMIALFATRATGVVGGSEVGKEMRPAEPAR
jgi:hypothetical protein